MNRNTNYIISISNEELERRAKITIDICGGIQPMHMVFYSLSIHYSAERTLVVFKLYDYLFCSYRYNFPNLSI